jgi:hypothetical protein
VTWELGTAVDLPQLGICATAGVSGLILASKKTDYVDASTGLKGFKSSSVRPEKDMGSREEQTGPPKLSERAW